MSTFKTKPNMNSETTKKAGDQNSQEYFQEQGSQQYFKEPSSGFHSAKGSKPSMNAKDIKDGMTIFSSVDNSGSVAEPEGEPLATVDHLDGNGYIKLARHDSFDGKHHWIPISSITKVEGNSAFVGLTKEEFRDSLLNQLPQQNAS